ncbi:MAG: uncharacterized protein QOF51_1711 [Chloroflexota bacterium]|nr:uncharacterized protein [Chloroflexota bacterium]
MDVLELLDWRRAVAELFGELRSRTPDAVTLARFRAEKDALFRQHPQSPLPTTARATFPGLAYWPWDPLARVVARFGAEADGPSYPGFRRIGFLEFVLGGTEARLAAYWIDGYAGGLFVPFRDATCSNETYGGGRYALDTIKSADHGGDWRSDSVILDFNYAYHPSCAYDARWVCPLAPPENWLRFPIRAGERSLEAAH